MSGLWGGGLWGAGGGGLGLGGWWKEVKGRCGFGTRKRGKIGPSPHRSNVSCITKPNFLRPK